MILLVTLAFGACGVLFGSLSETSYEVSATIGVSNLDRTAALIGIARPPTEGESGTMARRVERAASLREVQVDAVRRLRRDHPGSSLGFAFTAEAGPGLVRVGVRHRDPVEGSHFAGALAVAVVNRLNADLARETDRLIADLRRERRALGKRSRDFLTFLSQATLARNITLLKALRGTERDASVVSPAVPPDSPAFLPDEGVGPLTLLGLTLALIAAFFLDVFDRRPQDPRRLQAAAGLPFAGLVPRLRGGAERLMEAFQRLRVTVDKIASSPPYVVVVTSAAPAEGKSSVAVGLAEAAARAGRRACLIEADLRRPVLAERLGLDGRGLADVLHGADLEGSMQTVRTAEVELAVLPAGSPAARPGELLASDRLGRLVELLRARYDLVVVDSPPLSVAADAMLLVGQADLALVCARASATRIDELEAACRALRPVAAPAALVVSGVPNTAVWSPGVREPLAARRRHHRWQAA